MTWLRWRPSGRRIYDFTKLQDGQHVQGYYGSDHRYKIKDGVIIREVHSYTTLETTRLYVCWHMGRREIRNRLGYRSATDQPWELESSSYELYTINVIKEHMTMANKLMALVRLNKNQRKLAKVGIYDENGNLTEDGQEVLLNLVAKEYEDKLIELAKDWKDGKKKKDDDEDE